MYRVNKELTCLDNSQEISTIKDVIFTYSDHEKAEEFIKSLYDKFSSKSSLSGIKTDFTFEDYDKRFPVNNGDYLNCIAHYWLEETDYVFNGSERINISSLDYDSVDDYYYGRSVVGKDGRFGIIDLNFNVVLGLHYNSVSRFHLSKSINEPISIVDNPDEENIAVSLNGDFIVVIGKPKREELMSSIYRVPSKHVLWAYHSTCKWIRVILNIPSFSNWSAYSFYNIESHSFVPFLCQKAGHRLVAENDFSNGMAIIKSLTYGRFGAINMEGKVSVHTFYDELSSFSEDGVAVFCKGESEVIEHFSPAYYLNFKYKKGGKWGVVDKSGKELIPALYDYARPFSDGLAAVNVGGVNHVHLFQDPYFYMNGAIPRDIREMSFTTSFMGGKWGFVDMYGNERIRIQYDRVTNFRHGMAIVNIGGTWTGGDTMLNRNNLPTYGQEPPLFSGGLYGIINKSGELIVPVIYSYLKWDNYSDPPCIIGTLGGYYYQEDGNHWIEGPEKVVSISLEGEVSEEDGYSYWSIDN